MLLAVVAPTIFSVSIRLTRLEVATGDVDSETVGIEGLIALFRSEWVYAFADYVVQVIVAFLAFVILLREIKKHFDLYRRSTNWHDEAHTSQLDTTAVAIMCVAAAIWGYMLFWGGWLGSLELIAEYQVTAVQQDRGFRFPPMGSQITWFRGYISMCSIALSLWARYRLRRDSGI